MTTLHPLRYRGYREQAVRAGPETVHLDVTNACNLDCVTCWNYAPTLDAPKSVTWKRQRIDPKVFHRVLNEVVAAGAERIVLSGGGEPFTHPDIERFLAAVKARGLRLTVITNGTLCDYGRLRELRVDQVLLNTCAGTPETYAAYHPNQPKETFHRLVEGCRVLQGVTAVNMVQVINGLTAHDLVRMVDVAAEVGARVSFKVGDLPQGTRHFALTGAQKTELLGTLIPAARKRARTLEVRTNVDAFERQLKGEPAHLPPCFAGYLYSRVAVDGRVFFCCAHLEVGHVDDGTFDDVWRGPRYEAMRQTLHQGGTFTACERCGKHDMNVAAEKEYARLVDEGALE